MGRRPRTDRMTSLNRDLDDVPLSVFLEIDRKLASCDAPRKMPLHQGKTTFKPAVSMRDWDASEFDLLGHQHAPPSGIAALRTRIAAHHARTFGRDAGE